MSLVRRIGWEGKADPMRLCWWERYSLAACLVHVAFSAFTDVVVKGSALAALAVVGVVMLMVRFLDATRPPEPVTLDGESLARSVMKCSREFEHDGPCNGYARKDCGGFNV